MALFLRVVVILFEILYYSMFMKFARKEGKFSRYLLLFILFSIISFFMNDSMIISYAIILLLILYGLKYVVKLKITFYDLFFIFVMMLIKVFIEIILALTLTIFIKNIILCKVFMGIAKLLLLFVIKDKLGYLYKELHKKWDNNKFFIRYIFDILMFVYIIIACLFLIKFR